MRVDSCCCGCSLRAGSIAIGCFMACSSVAGSILFFTFKPTPNIERLLGFNKSVLSCLCMTAGVVMLVQMLAAVCLVYGVKKDKIGFLAPWIVVNSMYLLLALALITTYIVASSYTGRAFETGLAIVEGVYIALLIYFLIVVASYGKSQAAEKGRMEVA